MRKFAMILTNLSPFKPGFNPGSAALRAIGAFIPHDATTLDFHFDFKNAVYQHFFRRHYQILKNSTRNRGPH
jgi:hypothetical protein